MTNAIRTQINLLRNTKTNIRTAIMEKGVTVSGSDPFSVYPTRISQISATPGTYSDDLKKLLDGSLTSYSIPDGTERIRYSGFEGYTSLTSVTIPASVTYIGERAFGGCTSLQSITCLAQTPPTLPYTMSTTGAFYNTNNCPIYVPADSVDTYKSANGWSNYSSRIVGVSPYATFNSIVDRSISGDYTIPSDVTVIGYGAFYGCTSLTSVTIPSGVTSIGGSAFYNCTGLTSVTVLATTPPNLNGANHFNNTNNCPIYVPAASVETYKAASVWSTYASRITAIPS